MNRPQPLRVIPAAEDGDEDIPEPRYRRDSPWQLLRLWHLGPLLVLVALVAGSIALGDSRPAVLALWWMGYLTIGLGVVLGVIAGVVGLVMALRSSWKTRARGKTGRP